MSPSRSHRPGHRVRFLHTSDLHVGTRAPVPGPAPLDAVEALAPTVEREQVDAVLIAGDFFDHRKVSEEIVAHAAERLERIAVPIVVLPGNHDPYRPESPWVRCAERLPPNLHVLSDSDGELLLLEALRVEIWGQAHTDFHDFRPAAKRPGWRDGTGASWRVAMAHGIHVNEGYRTRFSYQIDDGELADLDAHYIALGHIDEHLRVGDTEVHAWYASSPIRSGSFALVDLTPEGTLVQKVAVAGDAS